MEKSFVRYAFVMLCMLLIPFSVLGQDFQQSYKLRAGSLIKIQNVSGDIKVTGYDGDSVTVMGTKKGRNPEQVVIKDMSSQGSVDVGVDYPDCHSGCNASVDFEVRVPRSTSFNFEKLSTASGDVEIENVQGDVRANTASGDVIIKNVNGKIKAGTASGTMRVTEIIGEVSASSASGDVEVSIKHLDGGTGNMNFNSASGDVRVSMPSNLDATVSLSTVSGDVKTDFPIEIEKDKWGAGSRARGKIGSGTRMLKISSASGDVSLLRQ